MKFRYQAKSGPGAVKSGIVEADNQFRVIAKLRQEGMYPLSVEEIAPADGCREKRIPAADIASFTRQLSDLMNAGFSLSSALGSLGPQARTPAISALIGEIREGIEKGREFSSVLAAYPALFSGFYVSMVRLGEAGGKLEESLSRLADFKEKEEEVAAQFKSALTYPAFLLIVGITAVFVMAAFFIPRLAQMFSDFEQALPFSTRVVIAAGQVMGKFWWLFALLAACAVFSVKAFLAREHNRLMIDTSALRFPFFSRLIRTSEAARFAYSLGILLKSGIPILDGLGVAVLTVQNLRVRAILGTFSEKVRKGQSLSSCLRAEKQLFPEILYRMTAVGEESGELPAMLLKASMSFETEVSRDLKRLVSLVEPLLVICIGGFMVAVVFSILLPVFQLDFLPQ